MAYLTVNKFGEEEIHSIIPIRHSICISTNGELKPIPAEWLSESEPCDCGDTINSAIALPKGSIKKLIGRELTWEDEPYYLEEGV